MAKGQKSQRKPRIVDGQNRVALPSEVRKALQIGPGDYIMFNIEGKKVVIRKTKWVEVDD